MRSTAVSKLESFRILQVTPTFYPATYYGGPIFSTYALCDALAAKPGVLLRVLTTDAAGPEPSQRLDVKPFPTQYPPGYPVFFTRRVLGQAIAPGLLARLWSMIGWADVVHLTGAYSFPTIPTLALAHMRRRPVLWSPRGALLASHAWADARRQHAKRAWERVCQGVMASSTLLHTTSEEEKTASIARMPGIRAVVIPNGVDVPPPFASRRWKPDGILRLMFLGRIDPKKGLPALIEAVGLLEHGAVRLGIYGTGDAEYVGGLKRLVASRGLEAVAHFHGHVDGDKKRQAFAEADVCVLPSFSENFGMVVAEALAHGLPVIVSRGVPWPELDRRGCGRWVDNSPASLAAAISSMRDQDLAVMGATGRRWMEAEFDWDRIAALTLETMRALPHSSARDEAHNQTKSAQ
jgi:glycosyltransferase involved in cell wall biosynthesis